MEDSWGPARRAEFFIKFWRFFHCDRRVLGSTAHTYGVDVQTIHIGSGRLPILTIPRVKAAAAVLKALGARKPHQMWNFAAIAVRLAAVLPGVSGELGTCVSVIYHTAARSGEACGRAKGTTVVAAMDWSRCRGKDIHYHECLLDDPALLYVSLHVFRKNHAFSGMYVPLYVTGGAGCPVARLRALWLAAGRPLVGKLFPTVELAHVVALTRRVARALRLPPQHFASYALRRGWPNALQQAGADPAHVSVLMGHALPQDDVSGSKRSGPVSAVHADYIDACAVEILPFARKAAHLALRSISVGTKATNATAAVMEFNPRF